MLRWRLLLGTTFVAALVGLAWLDAHAQVPGTWLFPLAAVVALAATQEILSLLAARGLHPAAPAVYGGNLTILAAAALPAVANQRTAGLAWPAVATALAIIALFLTEMRRFDQPGQSMVRLAAGILALFYVGGLFSFVVALRLAGTDRQGLLALAALLLVVKSSDIGAYTVGRLFGAHKMAPRLSPGKTWEGFAGAIAFAVLAAALALVAPLPGWLGVDVSHSSRGAWLIFGLGVGLAGIIGDLAESLLKRDAGRKDSSTWMPGFGGVLDLLDSILLAAPVAYLLWGLWWAPVPFAL